MELPLVASNVRNKTVQHLLEIQIEMNPVTKAIGAC